MLSPTPPGTRTLFHKPQHQTQDDTHARRRRRLPEPPLPLHHAIPAPPALSRPGTTLRRFTSPVRPARPTAFVRSFERGKETRKKERRKETAGKGKRARPRANRVRTSTSYDPLESITRPPIDCHRLLPLPLPLPLPLLRQLPFATTPPADWLLDLEELAGEDKHDVSSQGLPQPRATPSFASRRRSAKPGHATPRLSAAAVPRSPAHRSNGASAILSWTLGKSKHSLPTVPNRLYESTGGHLQRAGYLSLPWRVCGPGL